MSRILVIFTASLLLVACNGSDDDDTMSSNDSASPGDTASGGNDTEGTPAPDLDFVCPDGYTVEQGDNAWEIDGIDRTFHVDFPSDDATGVGVLVAWHGIGDTISNWRRYFAPDPDGDPEMPLAIITMHDTGLWPWSSPAGLYWEMFESEDGDDNREAMLFEAIVGCLDQQIDLEPRRFYSVGFSGGAIVSNMMHARYPELVHTGLAFSGVWFNDEDQVDLLYTYGVDVDIEWDPLDPDHGGTWLVSHGGSNDYYMDVVNFDDASELAIPWLQDHGRTTIDCAHSYGHSPHPSISESDVIAFFKDHVAGEESPYRSEGLPDFLSDACELGSN